MSNAVGIIYRYKRGWMARASSGRMSLSFGPCRYQKSAITGAEGLADKLGWRVLRWENPASGKRE